MTKSVLLCLSFVSIFFAGTASATSLAEALEMAYGSNPQLQSQQAELQAREEQLNQAKAARLPSLQVDGSTGITYQKQSSPFFNGSQTYYPRSATISGRQVLYGGGGISGRINLARVSIEMAKNAVRQAEQEVLFGAVTAYVDVQQNTEMVRIRSKNVSVLHKQLDAANARFDVGEITKTGVSQAKARLAGSRSQLAGAKAQLAGSRAAYERMMGQAPGTLHVPGLPKNMPVDLVSAYAWAEAHAPILQNAKLAEMSAVHGVQIAKAGLRPNLSLGAQASTRDNNGFSNAQSDSVSTSLQFTMPLFAGGANTSKVREAKQRASKARIDILQARRITREQVAIAWHAMAATNAVILANQEQVIANELAFDGVTQEAEVGLRTTLDVLDAEQELLDARLGLIAAKRDAIVAAYGILRAVGRLNVTDLAL